jgi:hypothetical protein
VPQTHQNAQRDLQIHRMQKYKFGVTCSDAFLWNLHRSQLSMKNSVSTFHASECITCSAQHVLAHFLCKPHQANPSMKNSVLTFPAPDARGGKHKFSVTCPNALFRESISVPPEDKKLSVDASCPRRTKMHYVSRRSHRMQKCKFGVMYPGALFMEIPTGRLEH